MPKNSIEFLSRDFWLNEGQKHYSKPYFRLAKCASITNSLSQGKDCKLLDIGCGPATLSELLNDNIEYFGIDIAIGVPAANLIEMDIAHNEIEFGGLAFDIVIAAGIFEYLANLQSQKMREIHEILAPEGVFITTYTNFDHWNHARDRNEIYNNIQTIAEFRRDLEHHFHVDRWFPSSHNWIRSEPRRSWQWKIQMPLKLYIPILSRLFAVNFFFICSQ